MYLKYFPFSIPTTTYPTLKSPQKQHVLICTISNVRGQACQPQWIWLRVWGAGERGHMLTLVGYLVYPQLVTHPRLIFSLALSGARFFVEPNSRLRHQ